MKNTNSLLLTLLLLLILLPCFGSSLKFNFISDTHYDPAYGLPNGFGSCVKLSPPLGMPGCDAPGELINSLFTDMSSQKSAYIFLTGDLQRHSFDNSGLSLNDTIGFLSQGLASVQTSGEISGLQVITAMGNNDMVPNYYFNISQGGNLFLNDEANIMKNNGILGVEESQEFIKCAYYKRNISPTLRVIVLHTLIWCFSVHPTIPETEEDPCGQFEFLTKELSNARATNSKVIIMSHIPPYINLWGVLDVGDFQSIENDMYWKPKYQNKYNKLISDYKDIITVQLYGHTHLFSYQAIKGGIPSFIISAITPLFGNLPSYMIAEFNENNWNLQNIQQRYIIDNNWTNGLRLEDVIGNLTDIDSLQDSAHRLLVDDNLWSKYITIRGGGVENNGLFPQKNCDNWCRKLLVCAMEFETWEEIKTCVRGNPKEEKDTNVVPIVLIVVFIVCLIAGVLIVFLHRRKQIHNAETMNTVEGFEIVAENINVDNSGAYTEVNVSNRSAEETR